MNTLDQVFIKAFAKDRSRRPPAGDSDPPRVDERSDVNRDVVDSSPNWVRIDSVDMAAELPSAHIVFPVVESYDADQVCKSSSPRVVVDDRLAPLDELLEAAANPEVEPAETQVVEPQVSEAVTVGKDLDQEGDPVDDMTRMLRDSIVELQREGGWDDIRDSVDLFPDDDPQPMATADLPAEEELDKETTNDEVERETRPSEESFEYEPDVGFVVSDCNNDLKTTDYGRLCSDAHPQLTRAVTATIIGEPRADVVIPDAETPPVVRVEEQRFAAPLPDELDVEPPVEPTPPPVAPEESNVSIRLDEPPAYAPIEYAPIILAEKESYQPIESFEPAWEVDAFGWPEICSQLDSAPESKLRESGEELAAATEDGLKVLAVTSTTRQEGRTTMTLAFARSAAQAGCRVALVDADRANPQLATRLGLEAPCDWHATAAKNESISEAAVASLRDNIVLFPLVGPNGSETEFAEGVMTVAIKDIANRFDLTIVDMPPIPNESSEPEDSELSSVIDMAVVVRDVQNSTEEQVLQAVASLRAKKLRAVGIVENFNVAVGE